MYVSVMQSCDELSNILMSLTFNFFIQFLNLGIKCCVSFIILRIDSLVLKSSYFAKLTFHVILPTNYLDPFILNSSCSTSLYPATNHQLTEWFAIVMDKWLSAPGTLGFFFFRGFWFWFYFCSFCLVFPLAAAAEADLEEIMAQQNWCWLIVPLF